ncbi:MAG TPA: hypothetical protein VMN57_06910 [Anaerolineales bacterium]|nr:hypothetical protein [Anaerolineales bacterium]
MSTAAVLTVWGASIAILLVVALVVALLLTLILRTGRSILSVAGEIWTTGKQVANNTIHIPMLMETNRKARRILDVAVEIVGGAQAIEQHADGCPGCPACVLETN